MADHGKKQIDKARAGAPEIKLKRRLPTIDVPGLSPRARAIIRPFKPKLSTPSTSSEQPKKKIKKRFNYMDRENFGVA